MFKTTLKTPFLSLILLSLLFISACNAPTTDNQLPAGVHEVKVVQAVQTTKYTYLRVSEKETEYWMAIEKEEIKPGETLYYSQGYEMKNFYSRELDKTFETVLFVQDPSATPERLAATGGAMPQTENQPRKQPVNRLENLKIGQTDGVVTIAELYKNREQFDGKKIKVRGLVAKLSKEIMKRNWMHVQDGTLDGENFDLTITSVDVVGEGNIATFEGIIRLKKDFGSGYFYEIIMEEAVPSDVELYE